MREKSHHRHGTAAIQKVTSGSGKSHQGRRITMAQPVSSIIRDLVKSSRSIAHSKQQQAAGKKQASSKQAASKQQASQPASKPASQQAAASSSKQQQAAGKQQQASSSRQAATSVCPLERMNKYKL